VGMIVRSHVAYGGKELIITGNELPWRFKKRSQAFTTNLEKLCHIDHIKEPSEVLMWCKSHGYSSVAIEINNEASFLDEFVFPDKVAIIVGNEGAGLSIPFLSNCDHVVTIRQFGDVGSLNVAVSASIAMYEFNRNNKTIPEIGGHKYKEIRV
jgi:tRNA G18 (ribose-2'-O)-methylase SpoU